MRSPILAALAAVLLGPVAVFATSKAYDVVPYGDGVAIQTSGGVGVTQYYRNTLDSLTAVSVWLGPAIASGSYDVVVYDSAGGQIAHNTYQVDLPSQWGWVSVPLTEDAEPVRGRTYKVVVTRSAGEITFAYDPRDPEVSLTLEGLGL
jgi:hypothetical protein